MTHTATCRECSDKYEAQKAASKFCGSKCRKTFNNRRALRGAQIYDMMMGLRFDRKGAADAGLDYTAVCALVKKFADQDGKKKTYTAPGDFMNEHGAMINAQIGRV